ASGEHAEDGEQVQPLAVEVIISPLARELPQRLCCGVGRTGRFLCCGNEAVEFTKRPVRTRVAGLERLELPVQAHEFGREVSQNILGIALSVSSMLVHRDERPAANALEVAPGAEQ